MKNLIQNGSLTIDLNCDGINDLRIVGEADQDYLGSTTMKSSELRISTLHSKCFHSFDSIIDSTFMFLMRILLT